MIRFLLALHIAGGSVALASMFLPLLSNKGGLTHRRSGWVFVAGMALVSVTALALSAARFLTDPGAEGRQAGLFLFYVAILTSSGVSAGVRVLRFKQRRDAHRHWWDLGLAGTLTLSGLALFVYGAGSGRHLMTAFSVIGIVTGGSQLAYWLRPPAHHMHWWFEHMSAMLGSCIATVTAFLVVNAQALGAETFATAVWLAPTAVGVPTTAIWTAYYRRRFGPAGHIQRSARASAAAATSPTPTSGNASPATTTSPTITTTNASGPMGQTSDTSTRAGQAASVRASPIATPIR